MNNYLIIALTIIASCGKYDNKKCVSQEEAILRCKADKVSEYFPVKVPDFEYRQCEYQYPVQSCY